MERWGRGGEAGKSTSHSPSGALPSPEAPSPADKQGPCREEADTLGWPPLKNTTNQSKVLPRALATRKKMLSAAAGGTSVRLQESCGAQGSG